MKKVILSLGIVLIFLVSLVSAGVLSEALRGITGKVSYVPKCTDSDGGNDIFKRGKAEDGKGGGGIDYCEKEQIVEYFCDMAVLEVDRATKACPLGFTCKNGACVEKEKVFTTSDLETEDSVILAVGEPKDFGFDSIVVTEYSQGEADITYTKKVRAKDGDMIVLGGSEFAVSLEENVMLQNMGPVTKEVEKEVEKVVYVEKKQEPEKKNIVVSLWRKLFG